MVPTFTTHCIVFTFKRSAQNSLLAFFSRFSQAMLTKNKNIYIHIFSENRGTHTYLEIYRASTFYTRIKANVSVHMANLSFVYPPPAISCTKGHFLSRPPSNEPKRIRVDFITSYAELNEPTLLRIYSN